MNIDQLYTRMKRSQAVYMAHLAALMKHITTESETVVEAGIATRPRIAAIQEVVCQIYQLGPHVMTTKAKPQHYCQPRQVAMAICRELTRYSLEEIGRCFGGRDHGTIIHASAAVKNRMDQDQGFKAEFAAIREACRDRINNMETPLFAKNITASKPAA